MAFVGQTKLVNTLTQNFKKLIYQTYTSKETSIKESQ